MLKASKTCSCCCQHAVSVDGTGLASSALFVFSFFGAVAVWHSPEPVMCWKENVSRTLLFQEGMQINAAAVVRGAGARQIFTKTFLDNFVFIGGCGTLICLLIALMLFSRPGEPDAGENRADSELFNINELMIFGLPVMFNRCL